MYEAGVESLSVLEDEERAEVLKFRKTIEDVVHCTLIGLYARLCIVMLGVLGSKVINFHTLLMCTVMLTA